MRSYHLVCMETTKLPIDAVPDITNNQVQVIIVAPALGRPILNAWLLFLSNKRAATLPTFTKSEFSRFGLSLVTIVFDDNIDVYWARQQVSERLQSVKMKFLMGWYA